MGKKASILCSLFEQICVFVPKDACASHHRGKNDMPTWKQENRAAFAACVAPLLGTPAVQQLRQFHQHTAATTRLDHCMTVAYFSFTVCRRFGLDYRAAARGGLLHDLYAENWPGSDGGALSRWRTHPAAALENARVFGLSDKEADIIVKHMWPLTLTPPRYRESFVVSCADKAAAILEKTRLTRPLGIRRSLVLLAAAC